MTGTVWQPLISDSIAGNWTGSLEPWVARTRPKDKKANLPRGLSPVRAEPIDDDLMDHRILPQG